MSKTRKMNEAEMGAVIVGITELLKSFGLPSKFCSGAAIIIGGVIGVAEESRTGTEIDFYAGIMRGILVGATTTGLYAATDKMIKTSKVNTNTNFNAYSREETH